jgi:hypothetical protein
MNRFAYGSLLSLLVVAGALMTASTAHAQDGMQAGGLAPPPPMPPSSYEAPPSPTEERLDDSKSRDSGRTNEWVYVEAEGGFAHLGLKTFNINEKTFSAGFIPTTASGGLIGLGAGVRLLFFTLGARARYGFFQPWQVFTVGGELGLHVPLGRFEPHFELGGGYAALGQFKQSVDSGINADAFKAASNNIQIHGFYVRATAGFDLFITSTLSVGVRASGEVMGLTRPGLDPAKVAEIKSNPSLSDLQKKQADLLQLNGSSYGAGLSGTAVVGLHF